MQPHTAQQEQHSVSFAPISLNASVPLSEEDSAAASAPGTQDILVTGAPVAVRAPHYRSRQSEVCHPFQRSGFCAAFRVGSCPLIHDETAPKIENCECPIVVHQLLFFWLIGLFRLVMVCSS